MANLDLTGVKCPLTIMRARAAIQKLKTGESLTIKANDESFKTDITAYCHKAGHALKGGDGSWTVTKS